MAARCHLKKLTFKLISITIECCTLSLLLGFLGIQVVIVASLGKKLSQFS